MYAFLSISSSFALSTSRLVYSRLAATDHSKAIVMLLLNHCLLLLPLFVGVLCLVLFYEVLSVLSSFAIILIEIVTVSFV